MTERDEFDADLIVLGFGAAGAAAAITAARLGAKVLILEKQPEDAHTPSTKMSGGLVMTFTDAEAGRQYLSACTGGLIPPEPVRAFAERGASLLDWMRGLEGDTRFTRVNGAEQMHLPGAKSVDVYQPGEPKFRLDPSAGGGRDLFRLLADTVERQDVDVAWEMPARALGRDDNGRVTTVEAGDGERRRTFRARRGIVLSTGGFEFDEAAKLAYLRASPMYFYGNPGNTGDGLRMSQALGADLWHMGQIIGRAIGAFPLEDGQIMPFMIMIGPPGYVITDCHGNRFANETEQANLLHGFYHHLIEFDPESGAFPRIPCYWFFDETRRLAGPLVPGHIGAVGLGMYDWSKDNSAEIENGWISKGNSIAEAAAAAGHARPDVVAATVSAHNAACSDAQEDPFGRPKDSMVPLDTPPYYCVRLWPGGSNTTGGPRRDAKARVIDVFGNPIPGLYAAGELGQVSGLLYPADGANLSEAICFGQIAAEEALKSN